VNLKNLQKLLWTGVLGTSAVLCQPTRAEVVSTPPVSWRVEQVEGGYTRTVAWIGNVPEAEDVAVTMVFQDSKEGFLRMILQRADGPELISANLLEGTEARVQRTFVFPATSLENGASLEWLSSGPSPIQGVHLLPVRKTEVYQPDGTGPGDEAAMVPSPNRIVTRGELDGDGADVQEDRWDGHVVTAVLADGVEELTNGSEFVFDLTSVPEQGRFEARVNGIQEATDPYLIINGSLRVPVSVVRPGLSDPGYVRTADGWEYAGWLAVSAPLPTEALQAGENRLVLEWAAGNNRLWFKHSALQLRYGVPVLIGPEAPPAVSSETNSEPADSDRHPNL
jgi:hypothetical protein